jgi:hypothetical protein
LATDHFCSLFVSELFVVKFVVLVIYHTNVRLCVQFIGWVDFSIFYIFN